MVFSQYSKDVKHVAGKMCLRGLDRTKINEQLDMSISMQLLRRWQLLYQRTLDVICNPAFYEQQGRPVAVSHEESQFILDVLELEPTLYLDEIQAHLNTINRHEIQISTIHNKIKYCLLLTSKKARTVHPSQCPFQRANYICQIAFIPSDHFVFLGKYIFDFCSVLFWLLTCFLSDEAGVSMKTHCRDRAWAPRGRRTVRLPRAIAANRISVLPAVSLEGYIVSIAQEGTICRLDLEHFLETQLVSLQPIIPTTGSYLCLFYLLVRLQLPNMSPFPGPNSVIIMDNARVHIGGRMQELCDAQGVLLKYLLPYSPDMNPIEKVFSVMKSHIKRRKLLTGTDKDPAQIKALLQEICTADLMAGLFRSCNYPA